MIPKLQIIRRQLRCSIKSIDLTEVIRLIDEVIRLTEVWFRGLAYSFTDPKALFWWPTVVVSLAGVSLFVTTSHFKGDAVDKPDWLVSLVIVPPFKSLPK